MNKRGYKNISEKGTPALSLLSVILEDRIQSAQNKDQHKLEAVKIQAEGHEERLQKMIRIPLK